MTRAPSPYIVDAYGIRERRPSDPPADTRWGEAFRASRPYAERITDRDIADCRVAARDRAHWLSLIQGRFACDAMLGRSVERTALVQVPGLRAAIQAIGELALMAGDAASVRQCVKRRAA